MNKYLLISLCLVSALATSLSSFAQESTILTGKLDASSPANLNAYAGSQGVDVARISITSTGGDSSVSGFYVGTDTNGGLNNFVNLLIYDTSDNSLVGYYSSQDSDNLIELSSPILIGKDVSKIYSIRAVISTEAVGSVKVGFSNVKFATQSGPSLSGFPVYSNKITFVDYYGNPIPESTPSPTPVATPTPTPNSSLVTPMSLGFTNLATINLKEGDVVSSAGSGDPDVYIVNDYGYKRLFLNPAIFGFYGHLGGFSAIKDVTLPIRNVLVPSGLFRNCETNDTKVYGLETTGEDTGILHWINTSGEQAVVDDADFFKKVFCINSAEFNWYTRGSDYTSVNQVPVYSR